jgi:HK97 family phage prohead protease
MTTATDYSFRAKIFDVREQRRMAQPLHYEYRNDGERPQVILEGYAATFDQPYPVYGGPTGGGWDESIHTRAFDRTLSTSPDVQLLLNHEGLPLARTKSGTMSLSTDPHGLLVRATLDPTDPDVQRLMPKMRRGDMDEMSFAFRVANNGQEWDDSYTRRTITEINLQKGDVSVVNYGANPNTAAMLSTEAVSALAQLSNNDLVELRKMDRDQVERAMGVLKATIRASTPKKYSGVSTFADPGYLDSKGKPAKEGNGVKRYPLNSAARVRNALARFAQNKGSYTSEQQSAIMGKLRSAAKSFGITVDESKTLSGVDHIDLRPDAAGGTMLVAVLQDGSEVQLPSAKRGTAFKGAPYVWRPTDWPLDPHDEEYDKEQHAMIDEIADRGHDASCDGEHDDDESCNDNEDRDFADKQAKPFKKGGGREGDDDEKKGRRGMPDAHSEMDDYAGTDAEGAIGENEDCDEDEHEQELGLDLGLAKALEATIVTCYNMAEGDKDLRTMLAKARRQIRDLQASAPTDTDVTRRLEELRAEFGEPKTIKVSEGLAVIRQSGFADTMQPKTKAS